MKLFKKSMLIITAFAFAALLAVGCAKGTDNKSSFDLSLFNAKGIYSGYDDLSKEEQEKFLVDAANEGYQVGIDEAGRLTLSKDNKTYVLGKSKQSETTDENTSNTSSTAESTGEQESTTENITTTQSRTQPSVESEGDLFIDEEIMGNNG